MSKANHSTPQVGLICVNALASEIRRIDGNHVLGAAAIAEQLAPWIEARLVTFLAGDRRTATRT